MLVGDAVFVFVIAGARMARTISLSQRRIAAEPRLVGTGLGEHQAFVGFVYFVVQLVVEQLVVDVIVEIGRGRFGNFLANLRRAHRTERGDFDDLAPEEHVRQPKAPADEPAIAKRAFDLFRQSARGDVEIFRRDADQEVADTSAHQKGFVACLAKAVEHTQRIGRDRGTRYGMFGTGDDACFRPTGRIKGGKVVQVFKVPLGR